MELNKTLVIAAAAVLAAVNIGSLTIGGVAVAILLSVAVLAFLKRKEIYQHGIYVFLIAELSPLGLQSQVWLASLYQALSLLLLAAMLSSFQSVRPFGEYRSASIKMLVVASVFTGLGGVILYAKPLDASAPQLFGVVTAGALATLSAMLVLENYKMHLSWFSIRGS